MSATQANDYHAISAREIERRDASVTANKTAPHQLDSAAAANDFKPTFMQRVQNGVRGFVRGVSGNTWFTPGQPIAEVAPDEPVRRQNYPVGFNYVYTPRAYENVSFWQLRALANNYDLMRLVIETRKDQMSRLKSYFRVIPKRDEPPAVHAKRNREDPRIPIIEEFFRRPDREHTFRAWQRAIMDQQLSIDAVSILPRWRYDGYLYGFDAIDGATISPLIDRTGRQPIPPDPAFRQVIHGVPMRDLCAMNPDVISDQLIYAVRNYRAERFYGYSPVEQVLMTVNIALRRQLHQLEFYTDGTVPDALIELPDGWTSEEIREFEDYWNSILTGQTGERRRAHFLPQGSKVTWSKDWALKDEMDEYITRIVFYAFSMSPVAVVKMVNRASGQQISDDSKMEGLEPLQLWFSQDIMNPIIQEYMGFKDVEHVFGDEVRTKPLEQAQIDAIYLDRDVVLPSEVRASSLARDPLTPEQIDQEPSVEGRVGSGAPGTKDRVGPGEGPSGDAPTPRRQTGAAPGGAAGGRPRTNGGPAHPSPRMTAADKGEKPKPGGRDAGE